MFFKNSRYRKLPDEVTVDIKGRRLLSKSLRLPPEVSGTFLHTVEQSDRLDHLSYKYYKQPRKWWRLCDANPEFSWPQALLGKDPFLTQQFPVAYSDPESQPPWALLLKQIIALVGVEDAWLDDGEQSITVIYNRLNIQGDDLAQEIEQAGFTVQHPQTIGRTGKQIVIPPDVVG
jgi:hypothetical protein